MSNYEDLIGKYSKRVPMTTTPDDPTPRPQAPSTPQPADPASPQARTDTGDFTPRTTTSTTASQAGNTGRGDTDDITVDGARSKVSEEGWRGLLNLLGFNLSRSTAEREMDSWDRSINQPFGGFPKTVAFTGPKGGVGKTVANIAIGSTIAARRSAAGIVGIDADETSLLVRRMKSVTGKPKRGKSIATFAADTSLNVDGLPKIKTYLTTNDEGYNVIPGVELSGATAITPEQLKAALRTLAHYFELMLVDLPGAREAVITRAGLAMADAMVYTVSATPDALWLAKRHLEEIAASRPELMDHTVILVNHQSPVKVRVDLEKEIKDLQRMNRSGATLPVFETAFDSHLAEGGGLSIGLADDSTRRDYVKISAAVLDHLDLTQPTRVMEDDE